MEFHALRHCRRSCRMTKKKTYINIAIRGSDTRYPTGVIYSRLVNWTPNMWNMTYTHDLAT